MYGNRISLHFIEGVGGPRVNGRLREITKAELRKHKYKKVSKAFYDR